MLLSTAADRCAKHFAHILFYYFAACASLLQAA
jgi:hypothetical protein